MSNLLRTKVSGNKARYVDKEAGYNLDLVYITPRIVIMGWPSSGIESIYRNRRSDVKRWLEEKHSNYHIFNFCPRSENEYDASYFDNRVSRFPFPDHHPPPLAMIAPFTRKMREVLDSDLEAIVVIHCKAGKGRSGTMTCCYLITDQSNLDLATTAATDNTDLHDVQDAADESQKISDSGQEARTTVDLLQSVFDLHTSKRMQPIEGVRGVSIPSQRRFARYWSTSLQEQGIATKEGLIQIDFIELEPADEVPLLQKKLLRHFTVSFSAYKQSYLDSLNKRASAQSATEAWTDDMWDDKTDVIESQLVFVESGDGQKGTKSIRRLHAQAGKKATFAANRELQAKILIGKEGNSHSNLPDFLAVGYCWFIPSHEFDQSNSIELSFAKGEVDFFKPGLGIKSMKIGLSRLA